MGKKIIAVNASPRKGWNTDTLITEAAKGAESMWAVGSPAACLISTGTEKMNIDLADAPGARPAPAGQNGICP